MRTMNRQHIVAALVLLVCTKCQLVNGADEQRPSEFKTLPDRVHGAYRIEGEDLPIRNYDPLLLAAGPTLSKNEDGRMGQFKFRTVFDNPPLPLESSKGPFTVVFVAGNPIIPALAVIDDFGSVWNAPSEREIWAREARLKSGRRAYIYNDALSVKDVANRLSKFPKGSVSLLVIGGHGEKAGRGVFMGYNESNDRFRPNLKLPQGCENINCESLNAEKNAGCLETIRNALSNDAWVQLHACLVADTISLTDTTKTIRAFAHAFRASVMASEDVVEGWGHSGRNQWKYYPRPRP